MDVVAEYRDGLEEVIHSEVISNLAMEEAHDCPALILFQISVMERLSVGLLRYCYYTL